MESKTLSAARDFLHSVNTGANRRLFYPASGNDVGCSVGLFWNVCDSFYLIDPVYGSPEELTALLEEMRLGTKGYMEGMRITSSAYEDGFIEGSQPCRRYSVSRMGEVAVKRLCFVKCGTTTWLQTTPQVRYNVAICKDYAGINNDQDDNYPYAQVWGRLNRNGIFAHTLAWAFSSEEFDFAIYRAYGFTPLFKVTTDAGDAIGFGDAYCLFQKNDSATEQDYQRRMADIELMKVAVYEALEPFVGNNNYSLGALKHEDYVKDVSFGALHTLMSSLPSRRWRDLQGSPLFLTWLRARLPAPASDALIFDLLTRYRLKFMGDW